MPVSTPVVAPSSPSAAPMPDIRHVDEELGRLAQDRHDFAEFFRAATGSLSLAAGVDHRFVEISEDLDCLVFWSPARYSRERD
jgi:hypothetical protein